MSEYSAALHTRLAAYKKRYLSGPGDGASSQDGDSGREPQGLSPEHYQLNILPHIRARFWAWFDSADPQPSLHEDFHRLASSQAMSFNLFFPLLNEGEADPRLLQALGIKAGAGFQGRFDKVVDEEEKTRFDVYLESRSGQKIFFDLKLAEAHYGGCDDDETHRQTWEREYRPYLQQHVDAKWLEPAAFCTQYEILSNVSYLGRDADSGLVFILPKANERLTESDETIKRIVSKSLAPRVAILYLEYLVERLIAATADDEPLLRHYLEFREKYMC